MGRIVDPSGQARRLGVEAMIAAIVLVVVGWSLALVAWVAAVEYPKTARRLFTAASACVVAGLLSTDAGRTVAGDVLRLVLVVSVPLVMACGLVFGVIRLAEGAPTEDQP